MKKRLTKSLYSERWEEVRSILQKLRKERRLTQVKVAEMLGSPQSLIAKIESGERRLDVCQFLDYLEVLDADPIAVINQILKSGKQS